LRFAHKIPKNRHLADFLPYKLCKQPDNRDFCVIGDAKIHKCDRLLGKFARILRFDIRALPEASIKSDGFVIDTLEAAFWCFLTTNNYRDAVLKAVNLGEDTDTTTAVTGSLAGLAYSIKAIPTVWFESLAGYGRLTVSPGLWPRPSPHEIHIRFFITQYRSPLQSASR
jgi:ADP-ribosylglycohydrolase